VPAFEPLSLPETLTTLQERLEALREAEEALIADLRRLSPEQLAQRRLAIEALLGEIAAPQQQLIGWLSDLGVNSIGEAIDLLTGPDQHALRTTLIGLRDQLRQLQQLHQLQAQNLNRALSHSREALKVLLPHAETDTYSPRGGSFKPGSRYRADV